MPQIERLMRAECYAYKRWSSSFSPWWYRLLLSIHRRVKAHPAYQGVQ